MNWNADNTEKKESLSVVNENFDTKKPLTSTNYKQLLLNLFIMGVVFLILFCGAPLSKGKTGASIYDTDKVISSLVSDYKSSFFNMYSSKWNIYSYIVIVCLAISMLLLFICHKRRTNWLDYIGLFTSCLCLILWVMALITFDGGNNKTTVGGGIAVSSGTWNSLTGWFGLIMLLLAIFTIYHIKILIDRKNAI